MVAVINALARAKINLALDVLGKRPDGYHEVEMVMQSIELHDHLQFSPGAGEISLIVERGHTSKQGKGTHLQTRKGDTPPSEECPQLRNVPNLGMSPMIEGGEIPSGADNLVYRAADLIRSRGGVRAGVNIRLEKAIPVAAGLGGGSADAAVTLTVLNKMWGIGLSLPELMSLGEQLGADIPFCLLGGTALARGKGEQLEKLPPCPRLGLVLVKPPFGVSTASIYRAFTPGLTVKKPDNQAMVEAIRNKNIAGIVDLLANALEAVTISMHPGIAKIKEKLVEAGALGALMSGSGPTVFGVTADLESAHAVASRYNLCGEQVLVTETYHPR